MPTPVVQFRLPAHGLIYTNAIFVRSERLIDLGLWQGLQIPTLRAWQSNFTNDEERYFAACILDALIYRSEPQTIALMKQLVQRAVPDALRTSNFGQQFEDFAARLKTSQYGKDPGIRLVPVIKDTDPPTKSGPLLARLYRRHLGFVERWMIWPWAVPTAVKRGVRAFFFVDDFLGTGDQFVKFIRRFSLSPALTKAMVVYAPLTAHRAGVQQVGLDAPHVVVAAAEYLEEAHGIFDATSPHFSDNTNSPDGAREFYDGFLRRKGLWFSPTQRYGYGGLGLAYAFSHAVPNNSLPLFWTRRRSWQPLFNR
jgi:hypothetical protein